MKTKNATLSAGALKLSLAVAALALVVATSPTQAAGPNPNPRILPINSTPYGKSYGDWAAAWWQWALGIPEAQNPVADTTGDFCDVGQSGAVWLLAGTFGDSVERTCTIPKGKGIFMPVSNWIFGAGVFDCEPTVPGVTCDVPELRAKAAAATEAAELVEASIDDVPVNDIRNYRAASPEPFAVTFPDGAVFGLPAGTHYPQVADGYWLMLAPLQPGEHTIRVHVVNSAYGLDFTVVYHLTVQ